MPSTFVNCFTKLLMLPLLGGFPLIVSAATTVTRAEAFAANDAYFAKLNGARAPLEAAVYSNPNGSGVFGGGLPKRAGTNAAKISNPGGSADVRLGGSGGLGHARRNLQGSDIRRSKVGRNQSKKVKDKRMRNLRF